MPTPPERSKTRILVVDDEHVLADTLCIILNRAGFDASAVYSGIEALKLVRSVEPDLIISDVQMPDLNGIEAMILIHGSLPDCKIVLFSGHAFTSDLLEEAGARGYHFEIISKPIHPQELIAKLHSIIQ